MAADYAFYELGVANFDFLPSEPMLIILSLFFFYNGETPAEWVLGQIDYRRELTQEDGTVTARCRLKELKPLSRLAFILAPFCWIETAVITSPAVPSTLFIRLLHKA